MTDLENLKKFDTYNDYLTQWVESVISIAVSLQSSGIEQSSSGSSLSLFIEKLSQLKTDLNLHSNNL